ncbi:MAG: hypothetical protein ACYCT9_07130 [Leptospirillum sp.]
MTESSVLFDLYEKNSLNERESITDTVVQSGTIPPEKTHISVVEFHNSRLGGHPYNFTELDTFLFTALYNSNALTLNQKFIVVPSGAISSFPVNASFVSEGHSSFFFLTTPENQSPIQRTEENTGSRINYVRQSCKAILSSMDWFLQQEVVVSLMKQLDIKLNPNTWDPEDEVPSISSFHQLVIFYRYYFELKPSSITIANNGYFAASWYRTQREIVRLEFQPDGWVRWLVFLEPVESKGSSRKGTGLEKSLNIKKMLEQQYQVWSWMS